MSVVLICISSIIANLIDLLFINFLLKYQLLRIASWKCHYNWKFANIHIYLLIMWLYDLILGVIYNLLCRYNCDSEISCLIIVAFTTCYSYSLRDHCVLYNKIKNIIYIPVLNNCTPYLFHILFSCKYLSTNLNTLNRRVSLIWFACSLWNHLYIQMANITMTQRGLLMFSTLFLSG